MYYLPQVSGHITKFDNGGKTMSFMIEDNSVLVKYNEIWNNIKNTLHIKLYSMTAFDEKYIKAKVNKLNSVVNANFWGNKVPKEGVHHNCIACISIDSVMKMGKKIIHKSI